VIPSPAERKWLRQKYPKYWDEMDAVWEQVSERWRTVGPGAANEFAVHGTVLPTFCDLCQMPLSAGTPRKNSARVLFMKGASASSARSRVSGFFCGNLKDMPIIRVW